MVVVQQISFAQGIIDGALSDLVPTGCNTVMAWLGREKYLWWLFNKDRNLTKGSGTQTELV